MMCIGINLGLLYAPPIRNKDSLSFISLKDRAVFDCDACRNARTTTGLDGTLHADFKKSLYYHLNIFKVIII